jgi:hypothetical protein
MAAKAIILKRYWRDMTRARNPMIAEARLPVFWLANILWLVAFHKYLGTLASSFV